jgi:hypothetical protein
MTRPLVASSNDAVGNFEKTFGCTINPTSIRGGAAKWAWRRRSNPTFVLVVLMMRLFHRYQKDGRKNWMK